jgi:hypothetical protein
VPSQVQCPLGGMGPRDAIGAEIVVVASTRRRPPMSPCRRRSPHSSPLSAAWARAGVLVRNGGPVAESTTTLALTVSPQVHLVAAKTQVGTCDLKAFTCELGPLPCREAT